MTRCMHVYQVNVRRHRKRKWHSTGTPASATLLHDDKVVASLRRRACAQTQTLRDVHNKVQQTTVRTRSRRTRMSNDDEALQVPRAAVSRIMQAALPEDARIADDAKALVQLCASELIASLANAYPACRGRKRGEEGERADGGARKR